jgi:hypothetical protein
MPPMGPPSAAPMPGGIVHPGGSPPPGLPDLQAVGRAAMAEVLQGNAAATAARERLPDLIELADQARSAAPASAAAARAAAAQLPHSSTTTVPGEAQLLPQQAMVEAPGVWQGPPPAWHGQQPAWHGQQAGWHGTPPARHAAPEPAQRLDRSAWPGAQEVLRDRDFGQRVGDALYPFVRWIRESRAGWVGVIALFGITLPIMLLRQDFDVRVRLVLGFFTFWFWIGLVAELFGG